INILNQTIAALRTLEAQLRRQIDGILRQISSELDNVKSFLEGLRQAAGERARQLGWQFVQNALRKSWVYAVAGNKGPALEAQVKDVYEALFNAPALPTVLNGTLSLLVAAP